MEEPRRHKDHKEEHQETGGAGGILDVSSVLFVIFVIFVSSWLIVFPLSRFRSEGFPLAGHFASKAGQRVAAG
jgi:hypothetical protein